MSRVKQFTSVDAYIADAPAEVQAKLKELRTALYDRFSKAARALAEASSK